MASGQKPKTIIMVSGTIGSGKDAIGQRLVDEHGFRRFAFADPLKEFCCDIATLAMGIDVTIDTFHDRSAKDAPMRFKDGRPVCTEDGKAMTPRDLLLLIGTGIARKRISNSVWVDTIVRLIHESSRDRIVITDCRFPVEAKRMRREFPASEGHRVLVWSVRRTDVTSATSATAVTTTAHASSKDGTRSLIEEVNKQAEAGFTDSDVDRVIDNDHSKGLLHLYGVIDRCVIA